VLKCLQRFRRRVGITSSDKVEIAVLIKVNEDCPEHNSIERIKA
jgi:hypothetical protein